MFLPKKYRYSHLVIAVRSYTIRTASRDLPTPGSLPPFLPKRPSPHPRQHHLPPPTPEPSSLPCPSCGHSALRWNWPSRRGGEWSFWIRQGVPASRKCFSVPPSHCGAWLPAKDGVRAGSPQRGVCGHWGFRDSPHTSQQETSAETVKAALVAVLLTEFLLQRLLLGQVRRGRQIGLKKYSREKAQQRHLMSDIITAAFVCAQNSPDSVRIFSWWVFSGDNFHLKPLLGNL